MKSNIWVGLLSKYTLLILLIRENYSMESLSFDI